MDITKYKVPPSLPTLHILLVSSPNNAFLRLMGSNVSLKKEDWINFDMILNRNSFFF